MNYYPTALGIYPGTYYLTYATVDYDFIADRFMCEDTGTVEPYYGSSITEEFAELTDRLIDSATSGSEITFIGVTSPFHPTPYELRLEGAVLNAIANSDLKTAEIFHLDPRKLLTPFGNEYKYAKDVHIHIWETVQFPQYVSNMSEWKMKIAMAAAAAVTTFKICEDPPLGNSTY